jgi:hypothetical protein
MAIYVKLLKSIAQKFSHSIIKDDRLQIFHNCLDRNSAEIDNSTDRDETHS